MRDYIRIVEASLETHDPDGVDLSGDVIDGIFTTENRGYFIHAPTMKVYSFATFEHEGHVRSKGRSDDPFLRDYRFYGSYTHAIRHHVVRVAAYSNKLNVEGQLRDVAKTFRLWGRAALQAQSVMIEICSESGQQIGSQEFELPGQRGDLARFLANKGLEVRSGIEPL